MKTLATLAILIAFFALTEMNAQQPAARTISPDTTSNSEARTIQVSPETPGAKTDTNSGFSLNIERHATRFFPKKNPTIKLFGGLGSTTYDNSNYPGAYNSTNSATIELGFTSLENYWPSFFSTIKLLRDSGGKEILQSKEVLPIEELIYSGLFFSFQFDSLSTTETTDTPLPAPPYSAYNKLKKSLAGGFSSLKGANYKAANVALLNGGGIFWTQLGLEHFPAYAGSLELPETIEPLIADGIRFGDKYIAEIQAFKVADIVSLNLGVARSVIYERHLFWKWVGSTFVREIAQGVLGSFVDEIRRTSPYLYPVVSFVLQGALDFGFSELQKKKMNWPFNTPGGYIYDEFRVGLGFEF